MGIRKAVEPGLPAPIGTQVWHNVASFTLKIPFHGLNVLERVVEVPPGGEIELSVGYTPNIKSISPHLRIGPAPEAPADAPTSDSTSPEGEGEKPSPAVADPDTVRVLVAENSHNELKAIAKKLKVSVSGSEQELAERIAIARGA